MNAKLGKSAVDAFQLAFMRETEAELENALKNLIELAKLPRLNRFSIDSPFAREIFKLESVFTRQQKVLGLMLNSKDHEIRALKKQILTLQAEIQSLKNPHK